MKTFYCVNIENENARSLVLKISKVTSPGEIIFLTAEEIKLLTDKTQFMVLPFRGEEE